MTSIPIAAQVYGRTTYDCFFFRGRPTDASHTEAKKIAEALGVQFVDMLNPLRQAGRGLYFRRDGHWTARGHRVAANTLEPCLHRLLEERK